MSLYLAYASHPGEPSSGRLQAPHFNSTDNEHFGNRSVFVADLFKHNTRIEKAALHLSINRGTRSIVTSVTEEGVHFCEPRGGSTESVASWSRARAHQAGTDAVFQQLPTVSRACGNGPILNCHFLCINTSDLHSFYSRNDYFL